MEGERGKHVTIVAAVCSDGSAVAPTVILQGAQPYNDEQNNAYDSSTYLTYTESGWSNTEVFLEVMKNVKSHLSRRYPA